jgi:hypothetical protein
MEKLIGLLQRNVWIGPLIALLLLIVGFGVGLSVGWMTVEFKPSADDVAAAADSYAFNQNADLVKARLKGLSKPELEKTLNQLIVDRTAKNRPLEADRLRMLGPVFGVNVAGGAVLPPGLGTVPPATPVGTRPPTTATAAPTGQKPSGMDPLIAILLILLVVVLIAAAGLIFYLRILPNLRAGRAARAEVPAAASVAPMPEPSLRIPAAPAPTTTPGGLGRYVPTYVLGNDNYDTSYSLETARGEFLGECGMGISETIGEGKPDKVTAFDLWLFDKADVRTVTQILMSDFAFRDQTLRTKLATKGEPAVVEKGKTLSLETQSLRIEAHIVELVYAVNPSFPPNSHFQKLVVEIVPTVKEGVVVAR